MAKKEETPLEVKRAEALDLALQTISKTFGKGAVQKFNQGPVPGVEFIPTGSVSLDRALGGGIARGRIAEFYGPESSGKTTLTLSCIAECQQLGGTAAFIDAEHALDVGYAQALGVSVEDLLLSQPSNGEEALEIADILARSGAVDLIVIDSVAALVPKVEIEGSMSDLQVGSQARLMSKAMRKLTGTLADTKCAIIFTNQIRMKIGVMFGNPETTPGGNALKFYASQRLEIRSPNSGKIGQTDNIVGKETKVSVVKNKVAPPFKKATFNLIFGQGIDKTADLITVATDLGIVEKSGSWYSYQGNKIGQGINQVAKYLSENPQVHEEIQETVKSL